MDIISQLRPYTDEAYPAMSRSLVVIGIVFVHLVARGFFSGQWRSAQEMTVNSVSFLLMSDDGSVVARGRTWRRAVHRWRCHYAARSARVQRLASAPN